MTGAAGPLSSAPEWLLAAAMGLLSWAALRLVAKVDAIDTKLDSTDGRLIRVEAKIDNGLTHGVEEMKEGFHALNDRLTEHIKDEEERILNYQRATQRGGSTRRTRETDGG